MYSGREWREQDEHLDEMGNIAKKLKHQITDINAEVVDQNRQLTDIEVKLQKTQENMNSLNGQMDNMKAAIGGTIWCNLIKLSGMLAGLVAFMIFL